MTLLAASVGAMHAGPAPASTDPTLASFGP